MRTIWADTFAQHDTIRLAQEVEGQKLYAAMFELAADVRTDGYSAQSKKAANVAILSFLSPSAD